MILRLGLNAAAHVAAGIVTGALAVIAASVLLRNASGRDGGGMRDPGPMVPEGPLPMPPAGPGYGTSDPAVPTSL